MRRATLSSGIILICFAGLGGGAPVQRVPMRALTLEPGMSLLESHTFKANERASVIGVRPEGAAFVGLYVYDVHGNCVTWDDVGTTDTKADIAVEWFPTHSVSYTIEVRNLGLAAIKLELAVR